MVAGSDSIDDMAVLRHGGMRKLFAHLYASSTLGSFLRAFTFGLAQRLRPDACSSPHGATAQLVVKSTAVICLHNYNGFSIAWHSQ
jgi:hypothetical protein